MKRLKVLELFAGSRSFSKVAENMGYETFTTDREPFEKIDYVVDILDFVPIKVPFKPDIIWASPPCTYFSVASIGHHWNIDKTPKTTDAEHGLKIVKTTLKIIEWFKPKYYFIENPVGKLRKLEVMLNYERVSITYCKYGDSKMKPTDIWSNHIYGLFNPNGWRPRAMCRNGMSCHESAPRGSRTGTQGLADNYERSIVPPELCKEILNSCL